jgi:hypothetical protein
LSAVCQRTERSADRRGQRVVALEDAQLRGGIVVEAVGLDSVERWRRAARRAGRLLGWQIRTAVRGGRVYACSEDWNSPPDADQRAAQLFAELICDELPPRWPVPQGGRSLNRPQ